MSFLNTTITVSSTNIIPSHITRAQIFSVLHDNHKMLSLNPLTLSHDLLPESSSTSFFKSVPTEYKPPSTGPIGSPIPVYHVVEASASATAADSNGEGQNWRGGWASRFVPDSLQYETSMQNVENGMISITHAPMGVTSVSIWDLKERGEGEEWVLETKGIITSNRMLMGFIRTTIKGSYEKLASDFVKELVRTVEAEGKGSDAQAEKQVVVESKIPVVVEAVN